MPSESLSFTKMTGTGNDFIIFDARSADFPRLDRVRFSKAICRRNMSVGADGVVFIEKSRDKKLAFKWDFYNSDGSIAEMCGNASRCVGRFAHDAEIAGKNFSFQTLAGVIGARVRGKGVVEVEMPAPQLMDQNLQIEIEGERIQIVFWNTGVPHAVVETTQWDEERLSEIGTFLRQHEYFKKTRGTNVTFYEVTGKQALHAASFERGVEAITLACGTGAVAAAATAVLVKQLTPPLEVIVPGGGLTVNLGKDFKSAQLSGEVRYVCKGKVHPEALL